MYLNFIEKLFVWCVMLNIMGLNKFCLLEVCTFINARFGAKAALAERKISKRRWRDGRRDGWMDGRKERREKERIFLKHHVQREGLNFFSGF